MPFFLLKLVFSIAVLNIVAMAQNLDSINRFDLFSRSLERAITKDFSIETIFILIMIIIVSVIAVVLYEIHRSNKLRKEKMALNWLKFDYHAELLKLNQNDKVLLKLIAKETGLQDPNSIIKSPNVFENSLEKFYENEKIESMPDEKLENIRNLRRVLGFLPLSKEVAFTSTRQFNKGERCLIQIPESGQITNKGICQIFSTEERHWSVAHPEGPQVQKGTLARMSLTRPGDAEYTFKVQVLQDSDEELVLSHTSKLNRAQQRNWVRIDVSIPVEVTEIKDNHVGDIFSGKIIDMSGGGFGMILPVRLVNGSRLKLNFELPGQGPINDLPVKVVRIAERIHSVAFEGDVRLVQEQIIQYVFEKQRQDFNKVNK